MEKKTGKKIVIGGLAIVLIGAAAFAGGKMISNHFSNKSTTENAEDVDADAEKTLHLSLSTDAMEGSTVYQLAQNFANRVEDATNGKLVVDLYEYGMLGKNSDTIQMMGDGSQTADLLFVPIQAMVDVGCEDAGVMLKAGTFKNHEDFAKWSTSSKAANVLAEAEKAGVGCKGLFVLEDGFYQTFLAGDEPISGKTILGLGFDGSEPYYAKKGATYEFGPYVDIPDRVTAGTIIGAELPLDEYEEEKMSEYLPYIVCDNHLADSYEAVITLATADKIGEENVKILQKAGQDTVKEYADILARTDEQTIERLTANGATETKLK